MGQYYKVVNLDKKEFINPRDFLDGVKLLEFGGSADGTMLGLSILLADGNGRGGGDLYVNTCFSDDIDNDKIPRHLRVDSQFNTSDGRLCKLVVPRIAGRWKGDRIVIAGDYADKGGFIDEDRPLSAAESILVSKHYTKPEDYPNTRDLNLYSWTDIKGYKNISKDVRKALKLEPYYKPIVEKMEKEIEKRDRQLRILRQVSRSSI